ncbi:MAG: 4Fe-4S binding protein [Deltaproteobacteria bacterium]|nr:4Fe-4S binding protein [Deltaproteobacteria bacterium]
MTEVYERLRKRLDEMATGYPSTEAGVEIRLLKHLFRPEDAELFLAMSSSEQTPEEIAARKGDDPEDVAQRLEDMAQRGLVFRQRQNGVVRYRAIPFIVGIYEFQINNLNGPMLKDVSEYYLSGLGKSFHSLKTPHLRTIPVNKNLVSEWPVAAYDDAVAIIGSKERIAVAPCLCRKAVRLYGKGCDHSLETCLQFDSFADYYVENSMARYITKDEAMEILKRNEAEGLVIQPSNSQEVEAMCACCPCCCGMLLSLKLFPAPASAVKSNYVCTGNEALCTGCAACVKRCPVDAVEIISEKSNIDLQRCIGCGLCISTCPVSARELVKKSDEKVYTPPETFFDTFARMCEERSGD